MAMWHSDDDGWELDLTWVLWLLAVGGVFVLTWGTARAWR